MAELQARHAVQHPDPACGANPMRTPEGQRGNTQAAQCAPVVSTGNCPLKEVTELLRTFAALSED